MTDAKLGQLITGEAQRDAIHIAIAPATASETLAPGQDVGADGTTKEPHVGIVDPFLQARLFKGDRYWIFLYPSTITSLRHEWIHPAFDALPTKEQVAAILPDKAASRKWMEEFASCHWSSDDPVYDGFGAKYTAEMLIEHAKEFLLTGDRHVQQGSESLRDSTPSREFWLHFEVLTGMKVPDWHLGNVPFCCTC